MNEKICNCFQIDHEKYLKEIVDQREKILDRVAALELVLYSLQRRFEEAYPEPELAKWIKREMEEWEKFKNEMKKEK